MESLEKTLSHVESLRRDLGAEIVLQEGTEGRTETTIGFDKYWLPEESTEYFIPGTPRITEPDTQKQADARAELLQVYDSSEWYSARYLAGKASAIEPKELDKQMNEWLADLKKKAWLPVTKEVVVKQHVYTEHYIGDEKPSTYVLTDTEPRIIEENILPRRNARRDLIRLFQASNSPKAEKILKDIANMSWDKGYPYQDKEGIIESGQALSYSKFRIWSCLHPGLTLIGGFAVAAGAALGAANGISHYLAR